ncbi:MAG: hypothetical protein Q4D81_12250, partial [Eubacteriales bacterium]|nr:hypothetical protein [Eubacteriales bacterium]
ISRVMVPCEVVTGAFLRKTIPGKAISRAMILCEAMKKMIKEMEKKAGRKNPKRNPYQKLCSIWL